MSDDARGRNLLTPVRKHLNYYKRKESRDVVLEGKQSKLLPQAIGYFAYLYWQQVITVSKAENSPSSSNKSIYQHNNHVKL